MPPEGNPPAEQPRQPAAQPPAEQAPGVPAQDTTPRASDAERNQAIDRLRAAYVEGRLDQEEFDERSSIALKARTIGQLERLFDDLPASYRQGVPASHAQGPMVRPGPGGNRVSIAIMSGVDRRGPWRVPLDSTAFALMGGVQLDLRGATLSGPVTTITAVAIMGGIEIIVPPGIRVESSGFGFMGGWDNRARNDPIGPDAPVLRVRGMAFLGGVDIRTKDLPDSRDRRPIEGSA